MANCGLSVWEQHERTHSSFHTQWWEWRKVDKVEAGERQRPQSLSPSLDSRFLFSEEAISNNMISEGQKEQGIKRSGRQWGRDVTADPFLWTSPFAAGCPSYLLALWKSGNNHRFTVMHRVPFCRAAWIACRPSWLSHLFIISVAE